MNNQLTVDSQCDLNSIKFANSSQNSSSKEGRAQSAAQDGQDGEDTLAESTFQYDRISPLQRLRYTSLPLQPRCPKKLFSKFQTKCRLRQRFRAHDGAVWCCALSPD